MATVGLRHRVAWLVHALTGHPLRRRVDWLTALAIVALAVLALIAIPTCVVIGKALHDQQAQVAAREAVDRYQTTAVLTATPQTYMVGDNPENQTAVSDAAVRWTDHHGQTHSAVIRVPQGSDQGGTTPVWVDPSGQLVPPPTTQVQVAASAALTAGFLLLAVETGCLVVAAGVHRLAGAYARRAWAREWEVVEPRWTRPRP